MTLELIRDYLVSVGAHEDEIYSLTRMTNLDHADMILDLVTGEFDPNSPQFRLERIVGMSVFLVYGSDPRGLSLAIERLVKGIALLPPDAKHAACFSLIQFVDPHKIEGIYKALSTSALGIVDMCKRRLPEDVNAQFLFDAISRTVVDIRKVGYAPTRIACLARCLSKCNQSDFLKAVLKGARQYTDGDGDEILREMCNSPNFRSHPLVCSILSCQYIHGVDPFDIGWAGGDVPVPNIEQYILSTRDLVYNATKHSHITSMIIDYFCKV